MTNEESKTIMLRIMFDLLFAEDIQDALHVIARHLGLNEQEVELAQGGDSSLSENMASS
jgi:hypothetical protein